MDELISRGRALWGSYFWLPALPFLGYALLLTFAGELRIEHVVIASFATFLAYYRKATKRFYLAALPFFLLSLLYDSMRYWKDIGLKPDRILVQSLYETERALFGITHEGERITLNDFFAENHNTVLDVICAIPYGAYIPVMLGTFIYLYFCDQDQARRFAWLSFITHVLGFATYHIAPAAPPWYVHAKGFVVDLSSRQSPAALGRVDELLHTTYFHTLYGRGSAVFGALPSLHVTYPLYGLFITYRRVGLFSRAMQIVYAVTMVFAAIYLDHHYVIDVLLGISFALISFLLLRRFFPENADSEVREETAAGEGGQLEPS